MVEGAKIYDRFVSSWSETLLENLSSNLFHELVVDYLVLSILYLKLPSPLRVKRVWTTFESPQQGERPCMKGSIVISPIRSPFSCPRLLFNPCQLPVEITLYGLL